MSTLGRVGLSVFVVAAASLLVACSGEEAGNITETEVSSSALLQAPEEPTVRNSLIETNDDDSSSDQSDRVDSTRAASTTISVESANEQPVSTPGPTISRPVASRAASSATSVQSDGSGGGANSGSTSAQNEDSTVATSSTLAGTGGSGSAEGQTSGSGTPSDVTDDPAVDDSPPVGRASVAPPEAPLVDLADGTSTDLSDQVNGLTLLWFWSTDTPTSERESVVVQRFAEAFDGKVGVVAIGSGGERSQADDFLQDTELDVTTLWSSNEDAADHYDVDSLPHSLLIDGSGNIIGRWPGLPQEAFGLAERIT